MGQYIRYTMLGIALDVDPVDLPDDLWTNSANMVAQPGQMQRALGYIETLPAPLFPPYYLQFSPQLGVPEWVYCGQSNVAHVSSAGVHTDVTPAGMQPTEENSWSGGNLNGIAIVNSFENPCYYWQAGFANALPLPNLRTDTFYRIVRPFKYHLIGMNLTRPGGEFVDEVHWSNGADPGAVPDTWIPGPDNEAGDNALSDESGAIIDGLALRDAFYIYKQDSVYEMTFVGGAAVFRFRKVFGTVGVLAKNCIARVKGTHIVLGNGDIYRHDGQNMASIADGTVRRAFFSTIDDENFANSFVVYLEPQEEVWFCVPTTGNVRPNLALVWNVVTERWGYRILPDADYAATGVVPNVDGAEDWDNDEQAWEDDTTRWLDQTLQSTEDSIVIADAVKQKFFLANSSNQADGEGYVSRVQRLGLDLGNPQREKAIRRVWPRLNAPEGTEFLLRVFNQRDARGAHQLVAEIPFTAGQQGVAVNANARYAGFEIETQASVLWDISGFDVDYLERGIF